MNRRNFIKTLINYLILFVLGGFYFFKKLVPKSVLYAEKTKFFYKKLIKLKDKEVLKESKWIG